MNEVSFACDLRPSDRIVARLKYDKPLLTLAYENDKESTVEVYLNKKSVKKLIKFLESSL